MVFGLAVWKELTEPKVEGLSLMVNEMYRFKSNIVDVC